MHVPAEIGCRAIKPVVDHVSDFGAPCKRAIEHIVINAILGEQFGKRLAVMPLDGIAKCAEHGWDVHGVSPDGLISATAAMIRAMSCGRDRR
jgi:hypothetical protein